MKNEQVLCIKRKNIEKIFGIGLFTGFKINPTVSELLLANEVSFLPRELAENDNLWKQIIPYQLFNHKDRFFVYERGEKIGEQRLSGKMSIGIGGHINTMDHADSPLAIYQQAILRERQEELAGDFKVIADRFIGWINDESNPVGQVHLGAVHNVAIEHAENLRLSDQEDLRAVGWLDARDIILDKDRFETWSVLAAELFCSVKAMTGHQDKSTQ